MLSDQAKVFAESEGDRWFQRNKDGLDPRDLQGDVPLRLMTLYSLRPTSVLEIGASNGYRLAAIAERFTARAIAVEPSLAAIRDGQFGSQGTVYWNLVDGRVVRYGPYRERAQGIREPDRWETNRMYIDEMAHFLQAVRSGTRTVNAIRVDGITAHRTGRTAE